MPTSGLSASVFRDAWSDTSPLLGPGLCSVLIAALRPPRLWPCRDQKGQRLGDQRRLLRALHFERVLGLHDHLPAFSRLDSGENDAQPHARTGRDRRQKANLVDAVVEPGGGVRRDDADLHRERGDHRQRQIAVRDGAAKRTFPLRPFDVDMDPLMIAGAGRKRVDARLVDRDPIGNAELMPDVFAQVRQG